MSVYCRSGNKNFLIEGNIGAGKSTFLKIISKYLDIQIVYEPHQKWQNVAGHNLLDKFYKDPQRWAYTFQSYAFVSRVMEQEAHQAPNGLQILERSVYSDRYCFAKNCYELGIMTDLEWELYKEWFGWLIDNYTAAPAGFIYLQTTPDICYSRIQKRSRSEEAHIPFEYIKLLHQKHEDWLIHKKDISPVLQEVPVLILDCNEDFENNIELQKENMVKILNFIEKNYGFNPKELSKPDFVEDNVFRNFKLNNISNIVT